MQKNEIKPTPDIPLAVKLKPKLEPAPSQTVRGKSKRPFKQKKDSLEIKLLSKILK